MGKNQVHGASVCILFFVLFHGVRGLSLYSEAQPPSPAELVRQMFYDIDPQEFDGPRACRGAPGDDSDSSFQGFDLLARFKSCFWLPNGGMYSRAESGSEPSESFWNDLALIGRGIDFHTYGMTKGILAEDVNQDSFSSKKALPQECQIEELRRVIWQTPYRSPLLLEDRLNQFLHERGCLDHLKVYDHQGLDTLLKMNQFKYDFLAHPFIKPIKIIIGKHHTIRGVLALKPGMQKRPLVILRCGTFCDSEGGVGTSLILSHYYDSSPFHVLVLSNSTGLMAQMESGEFVTGGGSGASQVYDILKIIAKNPFASRIRGIHFVGVSLGGYEALQVGLMGDLMGQIDPNVAIKSSTAVCPAVDLSQSVRFVFDGGRVEPRPNISQRTSFFAVVKNHFLRSQFFLRRLRDGGPLHVSPENWWTLPSYGQRFYELKFDLVYDFFNRILFPDLNSPDGYRLYQPFMGISHLVSKRLGDLGEDRHEIYRALENYLDFHNHTHETNIPTHLLYSNDDWIVPSEFNGKSLASQVKQNRLKGKQNRGHNFLSFTETPLGSHCAQSISYRYDHLTQIYTASIMNAYEEAERDGMFETHSLSLNGFGTQGEQLRSTFSAPVKHVEYNFRVISEDIIQVNLILRRSQSEEAKYQFALDYDVLTTTDPDLTGPFNQVHSEALTRWANGNIVLTDQQGADIRVSLKPPAFVQWLGSKI